MERIDYLLDDDFDLKIENGDFVKGDVTDRAIQMNVLGAPGFMRQYPEQGFNVIRFKNAKSTVKTRFESQLREQLKADGFIVNKIDTSNPEWWKNFLIDAE